MSEKSAPYPLHVFRFRVEFQQDSLLNSGNNGPMRLSAAFSECTGLEATMEPKVIKEGGRNYGAAQRVGAVTFATVILKRGITQNRDLWDWFFRVANGATAHRRTVTVTLMNTAGNSVLSWTLDKALPIKFKTADLNGKSTEVGIEELHLAHEGLSLTTEGGGA